MSREWEIIMIKISVNLQAFDSVNLPLITLLKSIKKFSFSKFSTILLRYYTNFSSFSHSRLRGLKIVAINYLNTLKAEPHHLEILQYQEEK